MKNWFRLAQPGGLTGKELAITGGVLGICLMLLVLGPDCLFYSLFGIPCPGCGMTRAWTAALHLQLKQAFSCHPMFWSLPLLYLYILRQCRVFANPRVNRSVLGLILLGFLLNYIRVLGIFFGIL